MKSSAEKRLLKYAWSFKKGIMIGIFCLMLAVVLELAGPLIAKTIIDEHILGVEGTWQQVTSSSEEKGSVSFQGNEYLRKDRLKDAERTGDDITIMAIGKTYYFIDGKVPLSGKRSVDDGIITIETANDSVSVQAKKLSVSDVYPFFQPEKKPIVFLDSR